MFEHTHKSESSDRLIDKPSWSRIESYVTPDELGFILPPLGLRGVTLFFLFFTVIWNAMSWLGFIAALVSGDVGGAFFMSLFLAVGAVTFAIFLYLLKAEVAILINRDEISFSRTVFGKSFSQVRAFADLKEVSMVECYRSNRVPVSGVGLSFRSGRSIKFGSTLKDDEKQWLLSEIVHFRK